MKRCSEAGFLEAYSQYNIEIENNTREKKELDQLNIDQDKVIKAFHSIAKKESLEHKAFAKIMGFSYEELRALVYNQKNTKWTARTLSFQKRFLNLKNFTENPTTIIYQLKASTGKVSIFKHILKNTL